jgi:hypothetical protein
MAHDQTNTVQLPQNKQQENPAKKVTSSLQNRMAQPPVPETDLANQTMLNAVKELEDSIEGKSRIHTTFSYMV